MFLRQIRRKKDGKTHVYWNIVENRRLDDGRVVQRQVLYLGEIGSSQATAWRKAIEVFDEAAGEPRTLALFPGGSLRGDRRRLGGSCLSLGIDAAPAAAMGRVLARGSTVARAAIGPVLGRAAAAQPEGNALGPEFSRFWRRIG